jgi:hypothetical protein
MAQNADTMVLRSFHLPQSADDELRGLAFSLRSAKADLLRYFIDQGMKTLAERYGSDWKSWDRDALNEVAHAVQTDGGSAAAKEGILRDINRLGPSTDEPQSDRPRLEDLLSQIPTSDIASKIGAEEAEVDRAVHLLIPVLIGGLHDNAQDPKRASEIESAADSQAVLLDDGVSVDQIDEKAGEKAVTRIFGGNDAEQVASALAGGGGGNSDLIKQLLPILTPIALAYIGKQMTDKTAAPAKETAAHSALNDVLGNILGGMAGNTSLGTVLGKTLGSKAGDILGGLTIQRG